MSETLELTGVWGLFLQIHSDAAGEKKIENIFSEVF